MQVSAIIKAVIVFVLTLALSWAATAALRKIPGARACCETRFKTRVAVHVGRKPALEAGLQRRDRNRRFAGNGDGIAAGGSDPGTGHAGALHLRQHQSLHVPRAR